MQEVKATGVFKLGYKLLPRCIFAVAMSLIVFASMFLICNYVFTNDIGYEMYVYDEATEEYNLEYTYYYDCGEADGKYLSVTEGDKPYKRMDLRSELKGAPYVATVIIIQVFSLIIVFCMVYTEMWKTGDSERNLADFGHVIPDALKGLKVGLVASIPLILAYVGLLFCKAGIIPDSYYSIYRLLNSHVFLLITAILGAQPSLDGTSWLKVIVSVLTVFVIPLICELGYVLGARGISIKEKIIYKSSKDGKD